LGSLGALPVGASAGLAAALTQDFTQVKISPMIKARLTIARQISTKTSSLIYRVSLVIMKRETVVSQNALGLSARKSYTVIFFEKLFVDENSKSTII
jgi:hypothetical protein